MWRILGMEYQVLRIVEKSLHQRNNKLNDSWKIMSENWSNFSNEKDSSKKKKGWEN